MSVVYTDNIYRLWPLRLQSFESRALIIRSNIPIAWLGWHSRRRFDLEGNLAVMQVQSYYAGQK